eukprot:ctg_777.g366
MTVWRACRTLIRGRCWGGVAQRRVGLGKRIPPSVQPTHCLLRSGGRPNIDGHPAYRPQRWMHAERSPPASAWYKHILPGLPVGLAAGFGGCINEWRRARRCWLRVALRCWRLPLLSGAAGGRVSRAAAVGGQLATGAGGRGAESAITRRHPAQRVRVVSHRRIADSAVAQFVGGLGGRPSER